MKEKIARFMYGRYGVDNLTKTMIWISLGCLVLSMIFSRIPLVYLLLYYGGLLIMIYSYVRVFSRNHYKRYEELRKFENFKMKWKKYFAQRKTHHIYKCPSCKQKIRIPRGKGKIEVTCPKCKTKFIKHS